MSEKGPFGGFPRSEKRESHESKGISRRGFLMGAAAAGAAALAPKELGKETPDEPPPESAPQPEQRAEREHVIEGGNFETRVAGYQEWWQLRRDEILFVDKTGAPVGEPVPFQDFTIEKNGKPYMLMPAPKDANGNYEIANIPREWIEYVKELHAKKHGVAIEALTQLNVTEDFRQALAQKDEPKLVEGIQNGTIKTNFDIVHYFGDKPVQGAPEYSRIEYVRERVAFKHPRMSDTIKQELRELLPAICAKESKFNDDLKSSVGARGISQFMLSTWEGLGYESYGDFEPLTKQTEAMGKHLDNIYSEIRAGGVEELMEEFILPLFPSREAFERDFIVPCMVNAYNPGGGTMRVAIQRFLEANEPAGLLQRYRGNAGKELFFALSKFAEASEQEHLDAYQGRSAEYAYYIYAACDVFNEEQREGMSAH